MLIRKLRHWFGIHYAIPVYVHHSGRTVGYFCSICGAPMQARDCFSYSTKTLGPDWIAAELKPNWNQFTHEPEEV